MGLVLEPLPPHAQSSSEGMQLIVLVGHQVGPPVVYGPEAGRLPPIVQVDGHWAGPIR
jgi:hypothetical protein